MTACGPPPLACPHVAVATVEPPEEDPSPPKKLHLDDLLSKSPLQLGAPKLKTACEEDRAREMGMRADTTQGQGCGVASDRRESAHLCTGSVGWRHAEGERRIYWGVVAQGASRGASRLARG